MTVTEHEENKNRNDKINAVIIYVIRCTTTTIITVVYFINKNR